MSPASATIRIAAASVAGLLLAGCTGATRVSTHHGAYFEVRATTVDLRIENDQLHCTTASDGLDAVDGRLLLNGVDHGVFEPGDRVVLTRSGRLLVNGVRSHPVAD